MMVCYYFKCAPFEYRHFSILHNTFTHFLSVVVKFFPCFVKELIKKQITPLSEAEQVRHQSYNQTHPFVQQMATSNLGTNVGRENKLITP